MDLKAADIVIAASTVAGPILAVQAQRLVDLWREKRSRRISLFRTLLETRATRTSQEHVSALNSVPIDFYGCRPVIDSWSEYFDHLNKPAVPDAVWAQKSNDLFNKLLNSMSIKLRFKFNTVNLSSVYYPNMHQKIDAENAIIRERAAAVLNGGGALRVAIVNLPDPAAPKAGE